MPKEIPYEFDSENPKWIVTHCPFGIPSTLASFPVKVGSYFCKEECEFCVGYTVRKDLKTQSVWCRKGDE